MILTPRKAQGALRQGARRFNCLFPDDDSRYRQNFGARRGRVSFQFLCLDFRLLCLYWILWAWRRAKNYSWALDQHGCSCYLCTRDSRKWVGNSWEGKPVQERRQIDSLNFDAEMEFGRS
jgi:hypothetical protein